MSEEVQSKQTNHNPAAHKHTHSHVDRYSNNFFPALSTTDVEIRVLAIFTMANTMADEIGVRAEPVDWKTAAL